MLLIPGSSHVAAAVDAEQLAQFLGMGDATAHESVTTAMAFDPGVLSVSPGSRMISLPV